jgi:F-type H+-transporting ATPase subunit epsilon
MAETLKLKIVTPRGCAVDQTVTAVTARSEKGEFCVLPNHTLFLTSIVAGKTTIGLEAGRTATYAVDTGFLEAGSDHVHIIAERCEKADDIDKEAVTAKKAELEQQLSAPDLDPTRRNELLRDLAWATARLSAVELG